MFDLIKKYEVPRTHEGQQRTTEYRAMVCFALILRFRLPAAIFISIHSYIKQIFILFLYFFISSQNICHWTLLLFIYKFFGSANEECMDGQFTKLLFLLRLIFLYTVFTVFFFKKILELPAHLPIFGFRYEFR